MRSISILFLVLVVHSGLKAQISHGGIPYEWEHDLPRELVPVRALDAIPDQPGPTVPEEVGLGGYDYGVQRELLVDVPAEGQWTDLPEGWRLCRVGLASEGAIMLSVKFDRWDIPEGALVYLYNEDRTRFLGAFDHTNRSVEGTLATAVLPGDRIVIEYRLPPGAPVGALRVSHVTHGYVDIFGFSASRDINPGYQSSPCHINVACPEAAAWQDQKRAVAMFLRNNGTGGGCTGVLLNNTAEPGKPYFHLAAHCYAPPLSDYIFYFNYEAPLCVGDTGPSWQTISGATQVAGWYYDDFVLVELSSAPPPSYNVYYAGWDRSGDTPQSGTVIHHPLYDVKKITFNHGPVTSFTYEEVGWQTWRNYWDLGITEAVGSGAPMFDQNKRMVGHMFNGSQNCDNAATAHTDCAKLSASWDGGQPNQRLRDWLDPSNTVMALDGYDPNGSVPTMKVKLKAHLEGPFDAGTGIMHATLRANGLVPLTEPYTAAGYPHVGGGGGETTTNAVLAVSNYNAIVDWVVVELRNKNNSQQVIATRSALIQRDGDIVDVDGVSDLSFDVPSDQYFIGIRHRNHLGIMTATALLVTTSSDMLDIGSGAVPLFGGNNATKALAGRRVMYTGDVNGDGLIKYGGPANDRDLVLLRIGGDVPTNQVMGYYPEDLNMDGIVRYTGNANDRDTILVNIGGVVPTAVKAASLP